MERLTDNTDYCASWSDCEMPDGKCEFLNNCYDRKIYNKLREYEDAEEQGLLVRLPVAAGKQVYVITTCKNFSGVLDGSLWGDDGGYGDATGYYCPYELNDSCPHEDSFEDCIGGCENFEDTLAVFEDFVESIMVCEEKMEVFLGNCECAGLDDFGKTVFLTREEAEAALAEMEG